MAIHAAIFDLDRTLIAGSSATVVQRHLADAGINSRDIPFADAFAEFYKRFGENWLLMQPARLAGRAAKGWDVETVAIACKAAADELFDQLAPFAAGVIEDHRRNGALLVLATTSPEPFIRPLMEKLGFDDLVCTKWKSDGGSFTGELDGPFVWGRTKAEAVKAWADANDVHLDKSYAYSDSYFDAPLLEAVGNPVAVNPDLQLSATARINGWKIRHFDKSDGVAKVAGLEIQDWTRPFMRPEFVAPNAKIHITGTDNIPAEGGALLVFNHRSYFDPTVMGLLMAKAGRSVRGLGKKEVFDTPIIGRFAKAIGGVRVERASGSNEPLEKAAAALRGGECVMMAPEGTIPRGPAFFNPELKGRWGAARLAAETGVPVVPIGIWGTEHVWPRNARLPRLSVLDRPVVTATVGEPFFVTDDNPETATAHIMSTISALLPPEAHELRTPSPEELARTFPPGYNGDPTAESSRRPGTDT